MKILKAFPFPKSKILHNEEDTYSLGWTRHLNDIVC